MGDHRPRGLDGGLAAAVVAAQEGSGGGGGGVPPVQGDAAHPQEKGLQMFSRPGNKPYLFSFLIFSYIFSTSEFISGLCIFIMVALYQLAGGSEGMADCRLPLTGPSPSLLCTDLYTVCLKIILHLLICTLKNTLINNFFLPSVHLATVPRAVQV